MRNRKRPSRDFIQNIAITVLAVSAVLLFAQSQLYTLGATVGSDYLSRFTGTPADTDITHHDVRLPLTAPVQVAVTGTYGRYANLFMTTADPEFEPLGTLLSEVLGSARAFTLSSEQAFLNALSDSSSVYYDFGSPLPLPVLAGLMGASVTEENAILAQRIAISDLGENQVALYLWDNDDTYLQCASAVSARTLLDTVSRFELGDASFAMDGALPDSEHLFPLTLFQTGMDREALPAFTVISSTGGSDRLLTALNFNPRTNLRYPDTDGTEVVVEGERTLRIGTGGKILYQSGGEDMVTISSSEQVPTLQQAALGGGMLVSNLLGDHGGEASLCLRSARQSGHRTALEFDYHAGGVPIRFSDGSPAATVILQDNAVEELSLQFRQYTSSGQPSLLLPLRQAMAVAGLEEGTELSIGYVDRGGDTVSAQWLRR